MDCTLAYSPCPNDTYIFYALAHQKIDTSPFHFHIEHCDIATLNQKARNGEIEVIKTSCVTYAFIEKNYKILPVGAALGKGYGPLVLTHEETSSQPHTWNNIALPGPYTTAHLLFKLWYPEHPEPQFLPFHQIIEQLALGRLDAGVVIHESRFTFQEHHLIQHIDLGKWWWEELSLPLPLGIICVRNTMSSQYQERITELIQESLDYAKSHTEEIMEYIRHHAQEKEEAAIKGHIDLYVNEFTRDLGDEGWLAVNKLLTEVRRCGWK